MIYTSEEINFYTRRSMTHPRQWHATNGKGALFGPFPTQRLAFAWAEKHFIGINKSPPP
jgi:hypothetical protein